MRILLEIEKLLRAVTGKPDVFCLSVGKIVVGLFIAVASGVLTMDELARERIGLTPQNGKPSCIRLRSLG